MAREVLATAVLIGAVVLIAAATDALRGKIYNWLTLPLLVLAPIWHYATHGLPGLWFSLGGFGTVAGVLLALTLVAGRGFGGGDLKLLAAIGALGGAQFTLWALLFTALSGPVIAFPAMYRRGIFGYTLKNLAVNLSMRYGGDRRDVAVGDGSKGGRLPYGICIALGTLIALFYPGLHW
jgi:prepilin peptidase CpaA